MTHRLASVPQVRLDLNHGMRCPRPSALPSATSRRALVSYEDIVRVAIIDNVSSLSESVRRGQPLCKDLRNNPAMDVGEPEVPTTRAEGQAFMVQAEKVKYRGMQIVNRANILNRLHT